MQNNLIFDCQVWSPVKRQHAMSLTFLSSLAALSTAIFFKTRSPENLTVKFGCLRASTLFNLKGQHTISLAFTMSSLVRLNLYINGSKKANL